MKRLSVARNILASLLLASLSCAPEAASPPAPPPSGPKTPAAAPVQPESTLSQMRVADSARGEEAAWQKIVDSARKEGIVNAYSFTWVGDMGLAVKRAFENRYGIKLEIVTGRGAEFGERLKTERRSGQVVGDMTEGSSGLIHSMKLDGLLNSVVADLPAARDKDVWWIHPTFLDPVDKANLVWRHSIDTPWINTNLVKPGEEPTAWTDLLAPRWKGKMSLRDPRVNAAVFADFVALLDKRIWSEEFMKALHKQEIKYILSTRDEIRVLSTGEVHLAVLGSNASAGEFTAQGAPVRAITMKEGETLSGATIAAVAQSPHPSAARVLLNWLLSPEGQSVAGKAQRNLMVRRDVPDFQDPSARTRMANPVLITQEYLDEGTRRFRDRWYDKLVGR